MQMVLKAVINLTLSLSLNTRTHANYSAFTTYGLLVWQPPSKMRHRFGCQHFRP